MAKKKIKEEEVQENLPVVQNREVVLEGDPEAQLRYATKAANALMTVVSKKQNPVMIRGKQYIEFGDWQVLARFYGATVEIEWTKPILNAEGKIKGYEARALVRRQGEIISSAEGMCTTDEKRWGDAEEYAVRSMAQTRTSAKALRNAFGWVAEMAGYNSTPVEEMDGVQRDSMKPYQVTRIVPDESDEAGGYLNSEKPPFENARKGPYPIMNETNDAHGLDEVANPKAETMKKMAIAKLLRLKRNFVTLGKSADEYREAVMLATNLSLEPENYDQIIEKLKSL